MTTEAAWAARDARVIREVLERVELREMCLQAPPPAAPPPHPDSAVNGRTER
jgi:hypothetical protein